jgi:hypothetical protein
MALASPENSWRWKKASKTLPILRNGEISCRHFAKRPRTPDFRLISLFFVEKNPTKVVGKTDEIVEAKIARQFNPLALHSRAVKPSPKAIARLRSALAFTLMLWCAGAGCIVASYAHGAAMSGMSASKLSSSGGGWGGASGSMGTHNCCKAHHSSERRVARSISDRASSSEPSADFATITLAEVPQSSDAMSCCPLTGGTFVVASRQRISNEDASAPNDIDALSIVSGSPLAASRSYALHLPYQSQTHLRLCVFLI